MKHIRAALLLLTCAATVSAGASAANMSASRIQPWLGTWSCNGDVRLTQTFTPIFGGNAMTISDNSKIPSQETVWFDAKRGKWIDEHADASGDYNVMEGAPSGKTIHFVEVYPLPANGPTLLVTMPSSTTYTSTYSAMFNGKHITQRDTCTKT
jgi:hypothetical protein